MPLGLVLCLGLRREGLAVSLHIPPQDAAREEKMGDLGRKMTIKEARSRALAAAKAAREERCRLDQQQLGDWLSELDQKDAEIARLKEHVAYLEEAVRVRRRGRRGRRRRGRKAVLCYRIWLPLSRKRWRKKDEQNLV